MTFPIRLQRGLWPLLLFGVRPGTAFVRLDGERLVARFGFFGAETPLSNIVRWDITGPDRWWRAVGVRATLGKPELKFGGSAHGGGCLHLREPVRIARLHVRDFSVTVDDLEGFGSAWQKEGSRARTCAGRVEAQLHALEGVDRRAHTAVGPTETPTERKAAENDGDRALTADQGAARGDLALRR